MKDRISALMDGELDDASAAREIDALARDAEARETWRTYHLISDALGKSRMLSAGFTERVAAELAKEPAVLAPGRTKSTREPRRWVAMAAGVAAVALVGWLGFAPQQTAVAPAVAPMAQAPSAPPVLEAKPAQTVPLPSGTSDYLLAHHGFSPRVSLGMAPYVRTVSDQARERK
jgi:sigma-E factor negative regulatory protein RseA